MCGDEQLLSGTAALDSHHIFTWCPDLSQGWAIYIYFPMQIHLGQNLPLISDMNEKVGDKVRCIWSIFQVIIFHFKFICFPFIMWYVV